MSCANSINFVASSQLLCNLPPIPILLQFFQIFFIKYSSSNFLSSCQARFTPGWKSAEWTWRWADLWNDLGFSLCAALSVCRVVTTSDEGEGVRVEVSTELVCRRWTPEIEFNKSLSSSIIRLANYSVTTSLIYKRKV